MPGHNQYQQFVNQTNSKMGPNCCGKQNISQNCYYDYPDGNNNNQNCCCGNKPVFYAYHYHEDYTWNQDPSCSEFQQHNGYHQPQHTSPKPNSQKPCHQMQGGPGSNDYTQFMNNKKNNTGFEKEYQTWGDDNNNYYGGIEAGNQDYMGKFNSVGAMSFNKGYPGDHEWIYSSGAQGFSSSDDYTH